ncbi:minichromosome maintenance protein MCM [archaeon]|jgi:replicative DNA helicase Mcm|nr:minichromosome maintenance protein MCM [archaeon]MBT6824056.1 minichromosome maintenance protein MCM [archaeon]MBT7107099.1 minichromosome maintenance protein MCM [archaeon]MBT7297711.1 minichromosome maintenance protein MCM [archaeon]
MSNNKLDQIEQFKEFLETHSTNSIKQIIKEGNKYINVDFADLSKFDFDLAEQTLEDPKGSIENAEYAVEQLDLPIEYKIRVRFFNLPKSQEIRIRDLRSANLDSLIMLTGLVRISSDVRPQVVSAKFECPSCGNILEVSQEGQQSFREPSRCSCGRKGKFHLKSSKLVDVQRIVLEESPEFLVGSEQPKRLSVFLKEDLVEPKMEKRTTPGSKVCITGIVKEIPILTHSGAKSTRFDIIMEASHVLPVQETFEDIKISKKEEREIIKLSKDPKILDKLTDAIAPSILGHREIKKALVFQLIGGTRIVMGDGIKRRGDIHILLVGDPGAGKSQLLQFISKSAPKGRFVSGKGASGAGLTAAVVKDEFLKGWSLEAGAMVLANHGICAIDELDKMSHEDRSALHEALEQQTVTISKASIQATLMAQTTVLAAANPKQGRFDPDLLIPEQIDLPPTLINRFDLIFILRDLPNKELDEAIATHILTSYEKKAKKEVEIDVPLLRKYISYAKKMIQPKLTEGALDIIRKYYVHLRNSSTSTDEGIKPVPISPRQLEALVRLSEASARLRLSKEVTVEDAKVGTALLQSSLQQVGFDKETGQIDIDRIATGIPASKRGKIIAIKEIITKLEKSGLSVIPLESIMAEAAEKSIKEDKVEEIIEQLKRSGEVFEPKRGFIQKTG